MLSKMNRLLALAESDAPYQTWRNTYQSVQRDFEAYANAQPEEIRSMLWAYAEGGRLMYQRLVNLACESMEFSEK